MTGAFGSGGVDTGSDVFPASKDASRPMDFSVCHEVKSREVVEVLWIVTSTRFV